ncbi:MAG: cob(I)yrinic acid a,c-diamide adenosyltransferase [Dehalococcoidales bacterium]|nr:cob(I)yrinic acid a,c-diamide adenosyltransferase [Dehalococcoidales bacterium]
MPSATFFDRSKMSPQQLERGLVSIFTGDGKGKTSAAIGIAVRAAGHGLRVFIAFFMKSNNYIHGEKIAFSSFPNVTIKNFGGDGWVDKNNIQPEDREYAKLGLITVRDEMLSGKYDIIIADEINIAADFGLIEVAEILKLIDEKPVNVELILTGRYANTRLIQAADMVTEMLMIKHPYNSGIQARKGIDY